MAAALIIVSGFIASFPLGYLSIRSGKLILISKVSFYKLISVSTIGISVCLHTSNPGPAGVHLDVDSAIHGHLGGGYLWDPGHLLPGYLPHHARAQC